MSGLLTLADYKTLVPDTTLSDAKLTKLLAVAQAIAEQLSGLIFGGEITGVSTPSAGVYRLSISGLTCQVGDQVRLLGGGVAATPFDVVDCGLGTLDVESATPITTSTTRALPVLDCIATPTNGKVRVSPRPIFSIVSVQTRKDTLAMWDDTDYVTTLLASDYQVYSGGMNLRVGIELARAAIPRAYETDSYLVKRIPKVPRESVRVLYSPGFYGMMPDDLQLAAVQLVGAIEKSVEDGGAFASESLDNYSYNQLTADQISAVPHSAIATLRRYANV